MHRPAPTALALPALALLLGLGSTGCARDQALELTAPEAYALQQRGEVVLIDIRRPEEWRETGVAENAVRVNMLHPDGPSGFASTVLASVGGDRAAPIALICRTGNRTTRMQRYLQQHGFTQVYNIKEGMIGSAAGPGWKTRGLPVEACPRC
jgi:rhodanese-related sulfurtransferase